MFFRFNTSICALICCLAASPAMAEFDPLNSSIILSGGSSKAQNACASPWLSIMNQGSTCSENHTALRLAYNYQFTPVLGFEISYGDLGNATGEGIRTASGTLATWTMKAIGWTFAGTGTLPLGGGFSLLGKVGSVRAEFNETLHTTSSTGVPLQGYTWNGAAMTRVAKNGLTYGIGVQYELSRKFAVRAQYESFGKYDVYGAYGVSAPRIALSAATIGIVLKF